MKRLILMAAVMVLTASVADAGPIRNAVARLTGRGGCNSCQTQTVQYQPEQQYATVYQPGPVQQVVGGVIYSAGSAVQQAGGVVAGYPVGGWAVRPTTCAGGNCGR